MIRKDTLMTDSIQKVLTRVRAPRVKITYDVETGGAIQQKELPFIIGVISDLAGHSELPPYAERKFTYIDPDNFNEIMCSLNPTLNLTVDNTITPEEGDKLSISLKFNAVEDFDPTSIINQVPELLTVFQNRVMLLDLSSKLDGNDILEEALGSVIKDAAVKSMIIGDDDAKINEFIDKANIIKNESQRTRAKEILKTFANLLDSAEISNIYAYVMNKIAECDRALSSQLDCILHNSEFQLLEGRWRGLQYLISHCELGVSLKVRLLCATRTELQKDLDKAIEFDQSFLFKQIYEEEFGTFGGNPYSCLVGDFLAFGRNAPDMELLKKLTLVAAAAHAPFLGCVDPKLFDLNSFTQLPSPRDLMKIFESSELASWNSFRDSEDSRYCALTLPRILMRLPYGPTTNPVETFNYEENVNGVDNDKFCWGNPAYALAVKIANAFSVYHWTAAIRGVEGGGLVEGLPAYTFRTSEGDMLLKCPTEIAITDRREKELSDLGLIALCHAKGTDFAAFFGSQTVQRPKQYNTADATANAAISARLSYMLNCSRFAHYIKMMMRDKIGSLLSKADIQQYLQTWIAQYVLLSDTASQEMKAAYPLREAKIDVVDDPRNPGAYKAVLFLRPHFQLEELTISLRLVANLPTK